MNTPTACGNAADLLRTLPIDLQQYVAAFTEVLLDHWCEVPYQLPCTSPSPGIPRAPCERELPAINEVVFASVRLPDRARVVNEDRQPDRRIPFQSALTRLDLPGLGAATRKTWPVPGTTPAPGRMRGRRSRSAHSRFWICSRICSINSFSSTAALSFSIAEAFEPSVLPRD